MPGHGVDAEQVGGCHPALLLLTSWAYFPKANSLETLVSLVDRKIYPADQYPDGQWDYFRYYNTHSESGDC